MNNIKQKLITFILGMCSIHGAFAQTNMIKNPGFEDGTVQTTYPAGFTDFQNCVPYWMPGCEPSYENFPLGSTPDVMTVGASNCHFRAPSNNFTQNLPPRASGVSNTRYVYCGYSQSSPYYKESILGTLTQVLVPGTYNISLYAAKIAGIGNCDLNFQSYTNSPNPQIEVVLRNSADPCSNGYLAYTSAPITTSTSWQQLNGTFTLSDVQTAQNFDRIEFRIKTISGGKGVFFDDMFLDRIEMEPTIISKQTTFCSGSPLTFTGSMAQSCTSHLWEIQQCTSAGALMGSPIVTQWIVGNPGTYTFPSTNIGCNKYYRVKLAPSNNIAGEWVETTKIIYVACTPTLSAIADQTVCANNNTVTITATTNKLPIRVYRGSTLEGTYYSSTFTLSPTTTTTYKFLTGSNSGCSASDMATITVSTCPNASFVFTNPGQTVAYESSVFGTEQVITMCANAPDYCVGINGSASTLEDRYWITVTEASLNPWGDITNNVSPNVSPLWNNWVCIGCTVPAYKNLCDLTNLTTGAHFQPGKLYRIVLAVGIPWHSVQKFIRITDCGAGARMVNSEIGAIEEFDLNNDLIDIYPNPTNGKFNVDFKGSPVQQVTVYDAVGKVVSENKVEANLTNASFDLSEQPAGIYFIKLNTGEKTIMKKVVKE